LTVLIVAPSGKPLVISVQVLPPFLRAENVWVIVVESNGVDRRVRHVHVEM
jgi:hypothetical protein